MSKHLVTHPEFIKAFVSECFSNGFNEKQASDLLGAYAKAEFYSSDKAFRNGVDDFLKQANFLNLLKEFGKKHMRPIVAGAGGFLGGLLVKKLKNTPTPATPATPTPTFKGSNPFELPSEIMGRLQKESQ